MEFYVAILLFTSAAGITPGPNNIMIMASGVNFGVKRSCPHLLGITIGVPIMVLAVGLGFNLVLQNYPLLHQVIKVFGIGYLLYLAWLIATTQPSSISTEVSKPLTFWQALLFQWVNPKALVMATSAISAYTSSNAPLGEVLFIAFAFSITAAVSVGIWLIFGASLKRFLDDPVYGKRFNILMAALLVVAMFPVIKDLVGH
ncbi:MAG: LysE family translocator, partial [Porticoccaceae bacterium]|nr:LysE family translocator [Porticoccaceae bacterium]